MRVQAVDKALVRLREQIEADRFEELETDTLEFKSVPATGHQWDEVHVTACAFLNTRGGIIILGIKEEGTGASRRYRFSGWQPHAEPNVRQIGTQFTDENGVPLQLHEAFPSPEMREFMDGRIAVVLVDELAADVKFAFYEGDAYKRILTGDHKIGQPEIDSQREFREAAQQARELETIEGVGLDDFDLDKLNDYINALNRPVKIETIKPDIISARPFLERKSFLRDDTATLLGVLVCGRHPSDRLGFRCQVHGYVDLPNEIRDKQDFADNILPLMESSFGYVLRNIQVGVSLEQGGSTRPQYPEELIRETVNNALAHRDYSINQQVTLSVKPGQHIAIKNPGTFRRQLVIEDTSTPVPIRRLVPEAKPRNPKLADVLRVYRKWEGRGIGMATMVNLCLQDDIDLPYYQFGLDAVTLFLQSGQLLDERMEALFQSYGRYIGEKMNGAQLTRSQRLVLSYLIKSEWANQKVRYTVLLSPDNNHFSELVILEQRGLIQRHERSLPSYPIYVADRQLLRSDYFPELRQKYGMRFDLLDQRSKDALSVIYRFNHFSRVGSASAKQVSYDLWESQGRRADIKAFDAHYRQIRRAFNKLAAEGFISRSTQSKGYVLSDQAAEGALR